MVKRLLQFVIFYAIIAIITAVLFIGVSRVCSRTYDPDPSDVFRDGETPLYFTSMADGNALVLGHYTAGANAGTMFYKIYDRQGVSIARQDFYISDTQLKVTDLIPAGDGMRIVCLCTPWDSAEPPYGAVFVIDSRYQLSETTFFRPEQGTGFDGGLDGFVGADNTGTFFAGTAGQRAVLFGAEGNVVCTVKSDSYSVIRDCAVNGGVLLTAGVDTDSSLGTNFRNALCEAYSLEGEFLWRKSLVDGEDVCSAVLRAEVCEDGFVLTGRSIALPEGSGYQSLTRLDSLSDADSPTRFHIGPDANGDNPTSLFIVRLTAGGDIAASAVYAPANNEFVPGLLQYDTSGKGYPLVLSTYFADGERDRYYGISILKMDYELKPVDSSVLNVGGDIMLYLSQDIADGGLYMCILPSDGASYHIMHFTSMSDAVNNMETVKKLGTVRDYYYTLRQKAPVLICLGFVLMLCASGAVRYRGRRKKR